MTQERFIERMQEAQDSGFLAELYRRGMINHTPSYYFDIYKVKARSHMSNYKLAKRFGCSKSVIIVAISRLGYR